MGEDLLSLLDANLAESNRTFSRFYPPSIVLEQEDVVYAASGTRFPGGPFNSVIAVGREGPEPSRLFDTARAFYEQIPRGFSIYARGHLDGALVEACERSGFVRIGNPPGMVLGEPVVERELGASVVIREVTSEEQAKDFVEVVAGAYLSIGMPPEVTHKVFSMPSRWLLPHLYYSVLYDHQEPVSAAMLLFSHGIAGVYWVGTLPASRGRGHADAIMRHVSRVGFARGGRAVILQATPFGEPVYLRLGYREVTRYPWFLVPKATA
jgi:ribosomal protein S18 acetylase RimI-like enzyme